MMKRAIRETTNRNATDLNAVAPLTMEAKKALKRRIDVII
jgi:hypothetical protein